MSIESMSSINLDGSTTVLSGTVGEIRRRSISSIPYPSLIMPDFNWWEQPNVVESWAKGGGIVQKERESVKKRLRESSFYDGLTVHSALLDLAVGAQTYLEADFVPQGATVSAADSSQAMLHALQASHERSGVQLYTEFRKMDATSLDYADSSFDRILSTFMMRYLSESHQKVAIAEMLRTIKDRGRIDLIDFDIVPNYRRLQSSPFTPMRMKMMFENPFFEDVLREHGAAVSVVMDEVPRAKHPFPARLYHLQLAVRKG